MSQITNTTLKQIVMLLLIALIGITLIWQLHYFIPGLLGGITFYILTRQFFYRLTRKYKWKKWLAALVIIVLLVLLFLIPLWLMVQLLIPKFNYAFSHTDTIVAHVRQLLDTAKSYAPQIQISKEQVQEAVQKLALAIPTFLNATMGMFINFFTALFLLYFMLMGGQKMEHQVSLFLPMNDRNMDSLWKETRNLVISNAVGIPLLIICQAAIAVLGYFIFGVSQPIVWGILTGLASIIPMVGTMIVWVPVCILLFASDKIGMGIGLVLYCAIIVSNIDNVLRFTLMKKIGDVHPLITVFGVIVGLQLFGIMGLIFGPLLIAYFFILTKIYRLEFSSSGRQK